MLINQQHPSLIKAYKKTLDTIESCNTEEQLKIASLMVENFKKLYKGVGYPKSLSYNLDREIKNILGSLSNTH